MNPRRPSTLLLLLAPTILAAAAAGGAGPAPAPPSDPVAAALAQVQADIRSATEELAAARAAQSARQTPLAVRRDGLDREVRELRQRAERLRAVKRQGDAARQELEQTVAARSRDAAFIVTALQEYRRSAETRLGPVTPAAWRATLAEIDGQLARPGETAPLAAAPALLTWAALSNRARLGGLSLDGPCLDPGGREREARFVAFGPLAYAALADGQAAGAVGRRVGSSEPALEPAGPVPVTDVEAVRLGREAELPVDASGGDALRVATVRETLWAHLKSGGPVMIPIALVGLLAVLLVVWKLASLRRLRVPEHLDLEPLVTQLRRQDIEQARRTAAAFGAPLAPILQAGIDHRAAPAENLEELMHERVLAALPVLDRHLGMLAVLGGVAPLLGLLGTVTGMIHTFQLVTVFGTGDAKLLSSGIAEALVTTEAGLVIAIPVVLVHAYLVRRVRMIVAALEQAVVAFVNRRPGAAQP